MISIHFILHHYCRELLGTETHHKEICVITCVLILLPPKQKKDNRNKMINVASLKCGVTIVLGQKRHNETKMSAECEEE